MKLHPLLSAAAVIVFLASCQKENTKIAPSTVNSLNLSSSGSKTQDYLSRIRNIRQKNAVFINAQLKNNRSQMGLYTRNAAIITAARSAMMSQSKNITVTSLSTIASNHFKTTVYVPGDFSNLQDAINYFVLHAPGGGGTIIIKGAITINTDLAVDVTGLRIQGTGNASITCTSSAAIHLLSKGIEISHLNLNVNIVINNAASGCYIHDNIISFSDSTGANMLIAIHGASGCSFDNNTIQEGAGGNNSTAVFSDAGCNGNEFGNDKGLNFATGLLDFGPPQGPFYESGTGLQLTGDINPVIRNCIFNNNVNSVSLVGCTKALVQNTLINITSPSFSNGIADQPVTDDMGNILTASSNTWVNNCTINPKETTLPVYFSVFGIAMTSSINPVITNYSALYAGNGISLYQCTHATLANNICNHNETGIVDQGSSATTADKNTASSNEFFDLLVSESATAIPPDYIYLITVAETNGVFENNTCNSNGQNGIALEGTSGCTLKNCQANNNASLGILVEQVSIVLDIPPYTQTDSIPSINNKITSNTARNNAVFDYQQITSTGITFTGNNFGTTSITQ